MKKLFLFCLMLIAWGGIKAQTDVTHLIADPDFDEQRSPLWKTNSFGRQSNNSFGQKHGQYYREVWSGGTAGDAYIYQDLTDLPVGTYTLTVTCQNIKQDNSNLVCTGAWIYMDDKKTDFNKPGDYSVTCVVKNGTARIGAEIKNCTGNYVCIDNFRLSYKIVFEDVEDYLNSLLKKATDVDKGNTSAAHTELVEARKALQKLADAKTSNGLSEAVKRMEKAISDYQYSLATSSNPMDVTSLITNPSFESGEAGWQFSNMGTQTNNDFAGKVGNTYAEKWTDNGRGVEDCSMKQTLTGIPNGRYRLTVNAQNIQQNSASAKQTGCFVFADNYSTEINVRSTYTVEFMVLAGSVTIGWRCVGATGNYCCVDNFKMQYLGADEEAETAAFNKLVSDAEALVALEMNSDCLEALNAAIKAAKTATTATDRAAAVGKLIAAIDAATASSNLYKQLDTIIAKGEKAKAEGKAKGQEYLDRAIASAKGMKESGKVDSDMVTTASHYMDNSILAYRVANGTGTAPKVTTFPTVIVGCNAMVARMTTSGSNIIERGYCWAEHNNPTIADEFSNLSQSNDETNYQPVYTIYGVKASTEYWVRPYAVTNTYAIGYGEPVRVITLPQSDTDYTYLWNGDDDHNLWLDNAMKEACAYYRTWTAIKGFHPTANYSPGTETADCSYGGWINVGPWRCNTGTMVHEMMHGTGVGQHGRWWSQELHPGGDYGPWWKGERGNRVTQFFELDPNRGNYVCNGDGIHVCYEGNGNDMQQIRSAILAQALYEDGLPAVSDGACPFYSYESIDSLYYYITNSEFGVNTKYLCETAAGALKYGTPESMTELLNDSAYAWRVLYDKMTGLYRIQNLKSGKYFNHGGSKMTLTSKTPGDKNTIHLMPARFNKEFKFGDQTITVKPYWFAQSSRVEYPNVMSLSSKTATAVNCPTLNFTDQAAQQYWLIYTPEQIKLMTAGEEALQNGRLERLIAGSKAVAASKHTETFEGQDAAFLAVVEEVEAAKEGYDATHAKEAVDRLFANLTEFLPAIAVADSIDVSFCLDDAALESGSNWDGLPAVKNGWLSVTNAEVFTATQSIPVKMPKGQYSLLVRGFQRPGLLSAAMKDYVAGTNNVKATITFNTATLRIKHVGDGCREEKLDKGGTESKTSGYYCPTNNAAYQAYMADGRYDNFIKSSKTNSTVAKTITVGVKNTATIGNDLLIVDGFNVYYYGNPDVETGIQNASDTLSEEVEGYYNVAGMRIAAPGKGITIIRYKDGHSVKVSQ